jgi:cell division initiation protein
MEVTAREVHEKQFHDAWRGYNQEEVDDFLDRVADTLERVQRENAALQQRVSELDQAVATSREAEEMLKKTLVTAQQAAEEAISKARAKAEQLVAEAEDRVRKAETEAREKANAVEAEARRKSADAERDFQTRKRDLDAAIDKLTAFETDLRQRLKNFLDEQQRSLDTLSERKRPEIRLPPARPARPEPSRVATDPRGGERPRAVPSRRENASAPESTPVPRNREEKKAPPEGSGSGLLWRDKE